MAAVAIKHAESSHIVGASYDDETLELSITFKGGTYVYEGVPADVVDGFANAGSAGKFLESSIKGLYKYRKV